MMRHLNKLAWFTSLCLVFCIALLIIIPNSSRWFLITCIASVFCVATYIGFAYALIYIWWRKT